METFENNHKKYSWKHSRIAVTKTARKILIVTNTGGNILDCSKYRQKHSRAAVTNTDGNL